jgi:hypothetical protein
MADTSFYQKNNSKEVARRRKMAQALAQQGQQNSGTEVVSGYAVPKSPLEGLAKGLATGIGAYQDRKADSMEVEMDKKRAELMAQAVGAYRNDPVAASQILMQDPEMSDAAMKMGMSGIEAEREAQAREMDFQRKADLQREMMGMRQSDTSDGGATGALVKKYMESTGADFPSALYAVQTGMRQGTSYNNGSIAPIAGYADVKAGVKSAEAQAQEIGKRSGEAAGTLSFLEANIPKLEQTAQELSALGKTATYTSTGQFLDTARKELGFDPRQSAVDRTAYIAKVDNEVLPLLRDTFGAAFTLKEGEALRATLGDPNKTPQEKDAVLNAFIGQKKTQIDALRRQTGMAQPQNMPPAGQPPVQETPRQKLMRLRAEAANRGGGQ